MKIYLWLRKSNFSSEISLFYLLNQWGFPHGRFCGFVAFKTSSILQGRSSVSHVLLYSCILRGLFLKKQRNICLVSSYFFKYTWLFRLESSETRLPFENQRVKATTQT